MVPQNQQHTRSTESYRIRFLAGRVAPQWPLDFPVLAPADARKAAGDLRGLQAGVTPVRQPPDALQANAG